MVGLQGSNWTKLLLAVISWCIATTKAQIYRFDNAPVVEKKSFTMLQMFFVRAKDDPPDKSAAKSYVKFRGLTVKSATEDRDDASLKRYRGIQVSLLMFDSFWDQVDPGRMCSTQEDIAAGLSKTLDELIIKRDSRQSLEDADVYRHQLKFHEKTPDQQIEVTKSGVYVLVLSNCGDFDKAVINGDVMVKNPHGFLPANDYYKMPFYAGLCGVYVFLGVVWVVLCIRWSQELLKFHACIGTVLFLGILEGLLWYVFLLDWNNRGIRSNLFFVSAVLASVTRTTLSYIVVLLACLGWGVTRPVLDSSLSCRIGLLATSYMILNFVRELVISFRHNLSLPLSFILLCLLPLSLMNGGIFLWIVSALTSLIETLKAQSQSHKLSVFQKLWWVIIIATAFLAIVFLVQIFAVSSKPGLAWKEEWIIIDCVPQVGFVFVFISIMCLWAPREDGQRLAYSAQIDGDEDGELGTLAAPEVADSSTWAGEVGVDEENDADSFWASTNKDQSKAPPDIIGAGN